MGSCIVGYANQVNGRTGYFNFYVIIGRIAKLDTSVYTFIIIFVRHAREVGGYPDLCQVMHIVMILTDLFVEKFVGFIKRIFIKQQLPAYIEQVDQKERYAY